MQVAIQSVDGASTSGIFCFVVMDFEAEFFDRVPGNLDFDSLKTRMKYLEDAKSMRLVHKLSSPLQIDQKSKDDWERVDQDTFGDEKSRLNETILSTQSSQRYLQPQAAYQDVKSLAPLRGETAGGAGRASFPGPEC